MPVCCLSCVTWRDFRPPLCFSGLLPSSFSSRRGVVCAYMVTSSSIGLKTSLVACTGNHKHALLSNVYRESIQTLRAPFAHEVVFVSTPCRVRGCSPVHTRSYWPCMISTMRTCAFARRPHSHSGCIAAPPSARPWPLLLRPPLTRGLHAAR